MNARDLKGMTALMYVAGSIDRGPLTAAVVEALIAAKANVEARTPEGVTALDLPVKYSKPRVVALLKNGRH